MFPRAAAVIQTGRKLELLELNNSVSELKTIYGQETRGSVRVLRLPRCYPPSLVHAILLHFLDNPFHRYCIASQLFTKAEPNKRRHCLPPRRIIHSKTQSYTAPAKEFSCQAPMRKSYHIAGICYEKCLGSRAAHKSL